MSDEKFKDRSEAQPPLFYSSQWDSEEAGPLDIIDRLIALTPEGNPARYQLFRLRQKVQEDEITIQEARQAIEKMDEVIKKVTAPANRVGIYLGSPKKETAQICVGGQDYYCNIDPRIDAATLKVGTRVLLNEAYVLIGDLGYDRNGPVGKIADVLSDGRLRIGQEHGLQSYVLQRSSELADTTLKVGDEIRVDTGYRVAIEQLSHHKAEDHYLDNVPELPWERIGGQKKALDAIKDAIELPLLHPDLFARFHYTQPKGFLLHGPPGCGKTLIGKATAYNLTRKLKEKTGEGMREYFMHIKGPEILNMWVGESERIVREIFQQARQKRKEGFLPFLFIDEAESILGTRRASRYSNILSTLVPMFCTEMDGIDSLNEMVIILASNRADLIDPAILRPGRIDRKIKVARPDRADARAIFRIYLGEGLPMDAALLKKHGGNETAALDLLLDRVTDALFAKKDENRFLEVSLRSGKKDILYRGHLCSGAIIHSVVERVKEMAIKRSIGSGKDEGINEADLLEALQTEYLENDIFPPSDVTEDWLKLIDYDPENVVKVSPIRPQRAERSKGVSTVI
jgi:proteasome-associated ATPase